MLSAVKEIGDSSGVVIPEPLLAEFGARAGDRVELKIEAGRLVIERLPEGPRRGWADDARQLAETGDDALVWPEFGNDRDADLAW